MNEIENITPYSEELYYTFNQTHYHMKNKTKKALVGIIIVLLAIAAIFNLFIGIIYTIICLVCIVALYSQFYTNTTPDAETRGILRQNENVINIVNTYHFFDSYFTIENDIADNKQDYETLYQCIETPDYLYLYLNDNIAFIVIKSNFLDNEATTLTAHLKHILKEQYITLDK